MSEEFAIGDKVRLVALPPYVKTAESMPMLRPSDVIRLGEEGIILDRRLGNFWSVRFNRGAYLLDSQYLERVIIEDSQDSEPNGHVLSSDVKPLIDPELPQDS
jgi:hypothetical protein